MVSAAAIRNDHDRADSQFGVGNAETRTFGALTLSPLSCCSRTKARVALTTSPWRRTFELR